MIEGHGGQEKSKISMWKCCTNICICVSGVQGIVLGYILI